MIQLNPWDLVVFRGVDSKGKEYMRCSLSRDAMWSDSLVKTLIDEGVKIIDVKQEKMDLKRKERV